MEDENPMFRTNTQFADFADDEALKEEYERKQKQDAGEEDEVVSSETDLDAEDEEEDPLDALTGNVEEDEDDKTEL